jgi:DNA-binding transcriptional LysR family regulator
MDDVDLNLLMALDALLDEGSVTGAARRLGLSASAMSRTLTRLRHATGDPLLVRAGRGLVPTPHAQALRPRVHQLAQDAQAVLRPPSSTLDLAALTQTFTLRASESFIDFFASRLATAFAEAAPNARLRFAPRPARDAAPLRHGVADLEIGRAGMTAPELRVQRLFGDRYVGVVRAGHPLLDAGTVTAEGFAACRHAAAAPQGDVDQEVDEALAGHGLGRRVSVIVPGFPQVLQLARRTDLVAVVPWSSVSGRGEDTATGLAWFELPFELPPFDICATWHPRLHADPAQRWFRGLVLTQCVEALGGAER